MKKFVKMSAVLAALVLVLSCFAGCKNDDDDDDSNLNGLWTRTKDEGHESGLYIQDSKAWDAAKGTDDKYYYWDEDEYALKIDGNKYTLEYDGEIEETCTFTLEGDKLTLNYETKNGNKTDVYTKVNETPIAISSLSEEKTNELFPKN